MTRATHTNTSWDVARFEVCAHKWADVSEGAYGAAILNDCKYGHSINESSVALTLIKSATEPDETADIGAHEFSYSLMPHSGDWRQADVPQKAYEFNIPVEAEALCGGNQEVKTPFACVNVPNVMIENVKGALNGEGTIIRLYECHGARTKAKLTLAVAPKEALFDSLMEDDLERAPFDGNVLSYEFKPYEILTLRIK